MTTLARLEINTSPDAPALTPDEAQEYDQRIDRNVIETGELLLAMKNRRGYEALGFGTWQEYCDAHGQSRSYAHRLMEAAEVSKRVGKAIPESHARELANVPEEKQAGVYEKAEAVAAKEQREVTAKDVGKAAAKVKPKSSAASSSKSAPAPREPGHPDYKTDEELKDAIERISDLCGNRNLKKALIDGTVDLTRSQIVHWADQKDGQLVDMEKLITVNKWTPQEAKRFLDEVPDESTRCGKLHNLAIAQNGVTEVTIDGFTHFVLTPELARKFNKRARELFGI